MLVALLISCAATAPDTTAALYGMWSSYDGADWRVLSFAEGDTYTVHRYPDGSDPAVVQDGWFDVIEEHLVTYPSEGGEYSNRFLRFDDGGFTLEVDKTTGETRDYDWAEALP